RELHDRPMSVGNRPHAPSANPSGGGWHAFVWGKGLRSPGTRQTCHARLERDHASRPSRRLLGLRTSKNRTTSLVDVRASQRSSGSASASARAKTWLSVF